MKKFTITLAIFLICYINLTSNNLELISAWESWAPYQYLDNQKRLTGLDIELIEAIVKKMNYTIKFKERPWARQLDEIKNGYIDLISGASKTTERENFAYFSAPYRKESAVLYILKNNSARFKNIKKLEDIMNSSFKLGVVREYYYGEDYKKLIKNSQFKRQVQEVHEDIMNYKKLLGRRIDGFLADPVATAAGLRKVNMLDKVTGLFIVYSDDIYVMFSKKKSSQKVVNDFNTSLELIKNDGTYDKIMNKYLK